MTRNGIYAETDRLIIRDFDLGDAFHLYQLVERNREIIADSHPLTVSKNTSSAASEEYIYQGSHEVQQGKSFRNGIFLKSKNQLIGQITIFNIDWNIPKCEMNYFIDQRYHKKGYATEALREICAFAFGRMNMQKIYLRIVPDNEPSIRVAVKSGFQQIGTMHNEFKTLDGRLLPTHYFELLPQTGAEKKNLHKHENA